MGVAMQTNETERSREVRRRRRKGEKRGGFCAEPRRGVDSVAVAIWARRRTQSNPGLKQAGPRAQRSKRRASGGV